MNCECILYYYINIHSKYIYFVFAYFHFNQINNIKCQKRILCDLSNLREPNLHNLIMKFIIIALLGLAITQAVFVKRNNDPNRAVFAQLEAMEEHELGKKLLDTIALQLNNKAPLSDIAKMLQQLRENLILNQQEADMKHAQDEVDCETEIYQYNRRIDFASNEITESTQEI